MGHPRWGRGCGEAEAPGVGSARMQGEQGCARLLTDPSGLGSGKHPTADPLQVPPEPLPGSASAGSTATPAGRTPPCGAGLPLRPGSPAGESLLAGLATERTSCRVRKCRGRGVSPSGGPRPFGSPSPALMLPCTPRTPTEGPPWASPRPALEQKRRIKGPNFRRLLVWVVFFVF